MDKQFHDLHIKFYNNSEVILRELDHSLSVDTRIIEVLNLLNTHHQKCSGRPLVEYIKID